MNIEIKKSKKPIKYDEAIRFMEKRLLNICEGKSKELFWTLKHNDLYTAGTSYKECEILDKKIKIIKTNRGGKITYHGPGQLICYFVIDLKKGNKRVTVIIEDDGPGIPEDQYKNVFKPFFRLDKSRSLNQSGVGLGLAIVEDIINSHGGNIQLGKSKYNGLQVKISLPF